MPEVELRVGAKLNVLSQGELESSLAKQANIESAREKERFKGISWMRIPVLTAAVSSNAFTLGTGQLTAGPREGFMWCIKRLVVNGLTSGATPDVANLYFNDATKPAEWQFNGNNFAYTFGKFELTMAGNDTLILQNKGSIASSGPIILSGEVLQVPAEMLGKLV